MALVRRKCRSEKDCGDCGRRILIDEYYYLDSNKTRCDPCNTKEKELEKSSDKEYKTVGYPVSGNCEFCKDEALGIMKGKKVCAKQEHIDMALGIIKSE